MYRGHVRNGRIALDEKVQLPDGVVVSVEVADNGSVVDTAEASGEPLGKMPLRHAGTADGLPSDLARNVDHYLYGLPKR